MASSENSTIFKSLGIPSASYAALGTIIESENREHLCIIYWVTTSDIVRNMWDCSPTLSSEHVNLNRRLFYALLAVNARS
jgi:hypothetical protein